MNKVSYKCDAPDNAAKTKVSVTALPIVSNSALYAGIDNGYFEKHGLDVGISTVSTVPATIAAVQGGTTDFAFTGNIGIFQAADQGISLTIVSSFAGIAPKYWEKMQAGVPGFTREVSALLVAPDSGINSPGDLNGKTVAIADSKGQADLMTRTVIKKHGGDPDSVKYTVMNASDAINALMAGKVDAAYSYEPAMTPAEQAGYRIISWPTVETLQEGPTSSIVASSQFVIDHPETAARFNCAVREANAFANANPDTIRTITAREQKVDPALLAKAVVPYFYEQLDVKGITRYHDLARDFGFISSDLDIESIAIPQALNQ
ncbi:ABC transporter substrate-binding protein (plasmid) [Arthrobacter sp. D3-18]